MIKLLGKKDCNACTITKNILTNKGIQFEYFILDELTKEEQDKYIKMATNLNILSLPLIVIDGKLKTLQEII